jgi:hypothetical protein
MTADNFDDELDALWQKLKAHVPDDDPLKADVEEYLDAGEWGICAEGMAVLSKRYGQDDHIKPVLDPIMMKLIILENEDAEKPE